MCAPALTARRGRRTTRRWRRRGWAGRGDEWRRGAGWAVSGAGDLLEIGGGFVRADKLIVNALAGKVSFEGSNHVGTLSGRALTTFTFFAASPLTVGSVPLVIDVGPQSRVSGGGGGSRGA